MLTDSAIPVLTLLDGRYIAVGTLGSGGQGTVYRAHPVGRPGQFVAVKQLHRTATDAPGRRRFERECDALRRLDGTPNITPLLDAGVDASGRSHLVTPVYDATCADRLASLGPLSTRETLRIGMAVSSALAAAHRVGIVHRDVKPSNVFVAPGRPGDDDEYVLGDFGVVRFDGVRTITSSLALSLAFAAPETIEDGTSSPTSDLYSLGATLYTLLCGRHPIEITTVDVDGGAGLGSLVRRIASQRPAPLGRSDVPADLSRLLDDLLAKRPAQRPRSADEVFGRLAHIASGALSATSVPSHRSQVRRRGVRIAAGTAFAVAAGLVLAGAAERPSVLDPIESLASEIVAMDGSHTRSGTAASSSEPNLEESRARFDRTDDPVRRAAPTIAPSPSSVAPAANEETAASPSSTFVPAPPAAVDATPVESPAVQSPPLPPAADATGTGGAPTTVSAGPCGDARTVLCESLDAGLAAWSDETDPSVASVALVDGGTRVGPVLQWTPTDAPLPGQSWVQRSFALPEPSTLNVRASIRVDARTGATEWFANVLAVTDEADRRWNVDASPGPDGSVLLGLYYVDAAGNGQYAGSGVVVTADVWHCVELSVDTSSTVGAALRIDGTGTATIDRALPDALGLAHTLRLGSGWTSSAATAPTIAYDDIAVSAGRLAC